MLKRQQDEEDRRAEAFRHLLSSVPYHARLGVGFERLGDELTARLPFDRSLIGNPMLPALHGGAIASFLEITALMQLAWLAVGRALDDGGAGAEAIAAGRFPPMPKTIDVTIDYLRSGRPQEVFARAQVHKAGRRVVHLHVEAWQEERGRPIAALRGNFLMPSDA